MTVKPAPNKTESRPSLLPGARDGARSPTDSTRSQPISISRNPLETVLHVVQQDPSLGLIADRPCRNPRVTSPAPEMVRWVHMAVASSATHRCRPTEWQGSDDPKLCPKDSSRCPRGPVLPGWTRQGQQVLHRKHDLTFSVDPVSHHHLLSGETKEVPFTRNDETITLGDDVSRSPDQKAVAWSRSRNDKRTSCSSIWLSRSLAEVRICPRFSMVPHLRRRTRTKGLLRRAIS